jgi:hypothetical protein
MKDFAAVLCMLSKANVNFYVEEVEGEHPCVVVPSPSPDYYSTGVTYSFNEDGSLYGKPGEISVDQRP